MKDFLKSPWLLCGVAAVVVFVLCFWAIDRVGRPDEETLDVKMEVIATLQTNEPLIMLAREQGWIKPDATEMTSVDAAAVDSIGLAFQGSRLQQFPEFRYFLGVEQIPADAFAHSDALKSITIPARVIIIDDGALAYCPALEEIRVDTANTHFDSRSDCNAIICTWKGDLKVVSACRTTAIPAQVRYIAPRAYCGCTALTAVSFPERMDEIGAEAFADCTGLQEVSIPQGVRFVEEGTFRGCTALRTVSLSKSVERLRREAFAGCSSLATISCMKKFPPIVENAFDAYTATVLVPQGYVNKYYTDRVWKNFNTIKEQ